MFQYFEAARVGVGLDGFSVPNYNLSPKCEVNAVSKTGI